MATNDLISREAAVREALDMYHALAARRDACQRANYAGGTVMWTAAAEIARSWCGGSWSCRSLTLCR